MKSLKKFFGTPAKAVASSAVIVAVLAALGTGTVFATSAIAEDTSIGAEKAKNFALADAGVDPVDAQFTRTEFDFEQGQFVYEVEFYADGTEYEYWIKANDGTVVKKEQELSDKQQAQTTTTGETVSLDEAKQIVLEDAGVSEADVTFTKTKEEKDDGRQIYDLEFYTADQEFEYELDAASGSILDKNEETRKTSAVSNQTTQIENKTENKTQNTTENNGQISLDEAKDIVLKDAGVNAKDATFTKTELDRDDGVWSYELDFYTDSAEYDYEVHAETGTIRSKEHEPFANQGQSSKEGSITLEEAKSIAAKHAGFSVNDVSFSKAKLETDDGVTAYEIEFYKDRMEYEYKIQASSGSILEYDSDYDD